MSAAAPPPLPWRFLILVFVVAVVISATIGYLGVTGHLGWGIPGTSSP